MRFISVIMIVGICGVCWAAEYTTGETWVTRLSPEERAALVGEFRFPEGPLPTRTFEVKNELPEAIDWRDTPAGSYVSGVRQQGICGSCWGFTAFATFESMLMYVNDTPNTDPDYSEQYLLSCNYEPNGCQGGFLEDAFDFLVTAGAPTEACFTYLGDDQVPCRASCYATLDLIEKASDWWVVTFGAADEEQIKSALLDGPLAATLMIHDNYFGYTDGVYSAHGSPSTGDGHTMLLIGWDDAQQCWIAKNSWGTDWGEDGFMRIAYDNGCGFAAYTFGCDYDPQWTPAATWTPAEIVDGEPVEIVYDAAGRVLEGLSALSIHWGHDDWQDVADVFMTPLGGELWSVTVTPPAGSTSLEFVFTDGLGTWDNNAGADWIVFLAGTEPAFVMDGLLDAVAEPLASHDGLTLYGALAGSEFYLALDDAAAPSGQDLFILVEADPAGQRPAPWTKAGQTVDWTWYLATEADNGWSGWFDFEETVQTGSGYRWTRGEVLEGTLDLALLMPGRAPLELYLAAAAYQTWGGGALMRQAPAGDGDGDLTLSEMAFEVLVSNERIPLELTRTAVGVEVEWVFEHPPAYETRLTASSGGVGWDVPCESLDGYRYLAVDRSPPARGGAEVLYRLMTRSVGGRDVVLAMGTAAAQGSGPLSLASIHPNPANPGLEVRFTLARPGRTTLRILDARGRVVRTLLDEPRSVGAHVASWDGRTDGGASAASGVYFAQVVSGDGVATRKLTLAR